MSLGQAVVDITGNTAPLQRSISGIDGSLRKAILGSAIGNIIADAVGSITRKVFDLGRTVGRMALGGGLSRVLDTENAVFMFQQMGLSMTQVDGLMSQLRGTFQQSPFAYPDVFNISSQLLASGSSLGTVNAHMTNVGNAAALMQTDLTEVGDIFVKIGAEGQLSTVRLNQFATRGVNMAAILAEALGVTEAEFRQMVAAGEVSSEMMHQLMADSEQLSGAMINAADTTAMQWSIFKTGIAGIGEALLAPWFGQDGTMVNFFKAVNTQLFGSVIPAFERLGSALHTQLSPILDNMQDTFSDLMDRIRPIFEFLNDNRETIARVAGTFLAVAGAVGTVTAALRFVLPLLGALLGPVSLVVLALTGLALGLQHAWENSETFREIVSNAIDRVRDVAETAFGQIVDLFNEQLLPAFQNVQSALSERVLPILAEVGQIIADRVLTVLSRLWEVLTDSIIPTFIAWWEFLGTNIIPIIAEVGKAIFDDLVAAWDMVWEVLDGVVIPVLQRLYEFFRENVIPVLSDVASFVRDEVIPRWLELRDTLQRFGEAVMEHIITPLRTAWEFIQENLLPVLREKAEVLQERVGEAVEALSRLWQERLQPALQQIVDLWNDRLGPAFDELWQKIDGPVMTTLKIFGTLLGGAVYLALMGFINTLIFVIETFTNVVNGILSVIDWVQRLRSNISSAWAGIRSVNVGLIGSFNALLDGAKRVLGNLVSEARALPGRIRSAVGNLGSLLYNAGRDVISGLVRGIRAALPSASSVAREIGGSILNAAKGALGISSPSREFAEIGKDAVKGLEIGLVPTDALVRAANNLAQVSLGAASVSSVGFPDTTHRSAAILPSAGPTQVHVKVYVGDREIKDIVRIEVDEHDRSLDRRVTAGTGGFRL